MQSLLITGGLGQVGSYLADRFAENYDVTVLDNRTSPCRETVPDGVELVVGDIRGPEAAGPVADADAVVHTAAQVSVPRSLEQPLPDAQNNVFGTLALLEAAREAEVERFVYFSSAAVYGDPQFLPVGENHPQDPLSPYGVSKLAGEKYAMMYHRAHGMPVVCIRPFNIYSPRQDPSSPYSGVISAFTERVKAGLPPVIYGDGEQTRDFISVHDIVRMVELCLEKKAAVGKVLNAGTGEATTVNELASVILGLAGSDAGPQYERARPGDILHSVADISAARGTGFNPQVSLEEGLSEFF
jgi:UDP-glucose 4-epimerase